jgi:hypothetical protein
VAIVNKVKKEFTFPNQTKQLIQVNSTTNAEGVIHIDYNDLDEIITTDVKIFKVDIPYIPDEQYTKTGSDLYNANTFKYDYVGCTKDGKIQFSLNWVFVTNSLPAATSGDFYIVEITINSKITIVLIIKIKDLLQ